MHNESCLRCTDKFVFHEQKMTMLQAWRLQVWYLMM